MKYIDAEIEKILNDGKHTFWDKERFCFPEWYTDIEIVNAIRLRSETIPGMKIGMISYKEFNPDAPEVCTCTKKELSKADKFEAFSETIRDILQKDADKALGSYFEGMSDTEIAEALDAPSYEELCKDLADTFLYNFEDLAGMHWEHIISDKQDSVYENRRKKGPAKEVKEKFSVGTVIVLDRMDDPQAPIPGTKGKVVFVDDIGQIHVRWENGSSLALIPGVDEFHIMA